MQELAFAVVENVPLAQAVHSRLADAEPTVEAKLPAVQSVQAAQELALTAFEDVPFAQAVQVRAPDVGSTADT